MTTIDKILNELTPYEDKVVINPLSQEEIEIIQSKFKKKFQVTLLNFYEKLA